MKKYLSLIVAVVFGFQIAIIHSQEDAFSPEFRVFEHEIQENMYRKDSLASAVVIYESGKSSITDEDFHVITDYKKKIKILKPEGFKYATIKVYLYKGPRNIERIKKIKAKSCNIIDGKIEVQELDRDHIYQEKLNDKYDVVTFTLPNVKVGTVFTYSYQLDSPYIYNYHEWEFQDEIPKVHSEYTASIPANYEYNVKLVGLKKLDKNTTNVQRGCISIKGALGDCSVGYYVIKNIPAFVEEDYMTTKENYLSKIEYELKQITYFDGTRDKICKEWKDTDYEIKTTQLGKELRKNSSVKNLLPEEIVEEQEALIKAKMIFNFVQENYTLDEDFYLFKNVSVKELIHDKTGNVATINTLLHNLFKENDFEVYPVISSTRKNGLPTKLFPVLSEFNYLLVKVVIDGKVYLLDASDKYVSFGQLPFRCLNQYGRQLNFKQESEWIPLEYNKNSLNYMAFDLKFITPSKIDGTLKTGFTGYHALDKKKDYYPNPENYIQKLENKYEDFELTNYALTSKGFEDTYFKELVHVSRDLETDTKNGIFLDPFFFKFFTKNPFNLQERTFPVDFGFKDSYTYSLSIDVGEFYEIAELPKNYKMRFPEGKAEAMLTSKIIGKKLILYFKVNFKDSIYAPNSYEALKSLMKKCVDTQLNSIIVLKKI